MLCKQAEQILVQVTETVARGAAALQQTAQAVAEGVAKLVQAQVDTFGEQYLAPSNAAGLESDRKKVGKAIKAAYPKNATSTCEQYATQAWKVATENETIRLQWVRGEGPALTTAYTERNKRLQDSLPELSDEAEALSGLTAGEALGQWEILGRLVPMLRQCEPGKRFNRRTFVLSERDHRLHPAWPTDLAEQAAEHAKAAKAAKVVNK